MEKRKIDSVGGKKKMNCGKKKSELFEIKKESAGKRQPYLRRDEVSMNKIVMTLSGKVCKNCGSRLRKTLPAYHVKKYDSDPLSCYLCRGCSMIFDKFEVLI